MMHFLSLFSKYIDKKLILYLTITIVLIILSALCTAGAPLLLKKIIDQLNATHHYSSLFFPIALYFVAIILERAFNEAQFLAYPSWENGILRNAYSTVFQSIFHAVPDFFRKKLHGTLSSQIYQAISGLDSLMFDAVFRMFPLLINFALIMTTIAFALNFTTALIVGIGSVIYTLTMYFSNDKLISCQISMRNSHSHSQGITTDLISSWKDIKLNNAHDHANHLINQSTTEILNKTKEFYYKRSVFGFIQSSVVCVVIITANCYEISRYVNGASTIGGLVLLNNYLLLILRPLESFSLIFRSMSKSYSDFMVAADILHFDTEQRIETTDFMQIDSIHLSHIHVDNVLHDIHLDIRKGEKIAITGESGAGKSTLLDIMVGFRKDYTGKIFINNDQHTVIDPSVLRNYIAYCNADARLITDTLFNNICLGKDQNIQTHLNITSLEEKIRSLEHGTESIVSESSPSLSSGEIQRIKIARTTALCRDFEFYDESSSAFDDALTEKILTHLLKRKDKAIVFITHNKKFLRFFDKVYTLSNGALSTSQMDN